MTSTGLSASRNWETDSEYSIRLDRHDFPFVKLGWDSLMTLLISKYEFSSAFTIFSRTLLNWEVKLIGR